MNLNHVMIAGRLTRDPELKALPSGSQVCNFALATSRTYKDRDGQQHIVVFGRSAEVSAQYLRKGQLALVEGRLQTRSWEKDGHKQYRTEIISDRVHFGPKMGGEQSKELPDYPADEINPDDIPF